MLPLCTAEEMRALDGHAINTLGIPSSSLMETAGRGTADAIITALDDSSDDASVFILCGTGNNGGDGLVVARVLHSHGYNVQVLLLGHEEKLSADSALNYEIARKIGLPIEFATETGSLDVWSERILKADVVVDAIFGTGLSRPLNEHFAKACELISKSEGIRVAIDIPSGLDATKGTLWGTAVTADLTVCLGALKWGLVLCSGPEHAGTVEVRDIGIPTLSEQTVKTAGHIPEGHDVALRIPARPVDGHKGSFGHVLAIAGSPGFSGAAVLTARGALRTGAGLVSVATDSITRAILSNALPEAMTVLVRGDTRESPLSLEACEKPLSTAKSLVIGPGLGQSPALQESLLEILEKSTLPTVIDADAIHLIAPHAAILANRQAPTVLTPHPGEMAALLGTNSADVQANRVESARTAAKKFNCVVVLKGHGTITASPDGRLFWNPTGGPWLATAGSGDVLAGCIGALLATNVPLPDAAWLGVFLHGYAGDMLREEKGESGLLAGEVADELWTAAANLIPNATDSFRHL